MQLFLGVKNFAKIEEAKICINNYTLLVGQNNSGKTFLMQLAQGVYQELFSLIDGDIASALDEECGDYCKYTLGRHNLSAVLEYFNEKLDKEKQSIVHRIFGKDIEIEKLYIDFDLDDEYEIEVISSDNLLKEIKKDEKKQFYFAEKLMPEIREGAEYCILHKKNVYSKRDILYICISYAEKSRDMFGIRGAFNCIIGKNSLFLPASRTGLMQLYRDYFANRADDSVSFNLMDDRTNDNKNAGLTRPMYEFLRFLQTYSEDERMIDIYTDELCFFEDKIIEGHIQANKQGGFSYSSKDKKLGLPMYLASSMINEVAPLLLAISSSKRYNCLIVDEVETSLHPQKQLELVRFLNRLNNKNISLIMSTHSDTFVSKVNNLYLISKRLADKEDKKDVLKRFGLNETDLIRTDRLFVYEFINQSNGKSLVKEILPGDKGYQFDLFTGSALMLYEEALRLEEIE